MRFQYIPPDEPPRVTIRVTFFLVGLLVVLVGAIFENEISATVGALLVCLALLLTAIDS